MLVKVKTKVPGFNGIRANTMFKNGVAMVDNPYLVEWFRSHGYIIESDIISQQTKPESIETVTDATEERKARATRRKG